MSNFEGYEKDYDEFIQQVKDYVLAVEEDGTSATVKFVDTGTRSYVGLIVAKKDSNVGVTLNLDDLYDAGENWQNVVSEQLARRDLVTDDLAKWIVDYEKVKSRLMVRLMPVSSTPKGYVKKILDKTDIEEVVYLSVSNCMSAPVTKDHVKAWGVTLEDVVNDAIENSTKLFPAAVAPLGEVLRNFGVEIDDLVNNGPVPIIVISNKESYFGAASILQPGVLENISKILGTSSYWLLPSSVHEWLAINDDADADPSALREMIQEINRTAVAPEDRLANDPFRYDSDGLRQIKD